MSKLWLTTTTCVDENKVTIHSARYIRKPSKATIAEYYTTLEKLFKSRNGRIMTIPYTTETPEPVTEEDYIARELYDVATASKVVASKVPEFDEEDIMLGDDEG